MIPYLSRQHAPVLSRPLLRPNEAHLERRGGEGKGGMDVLPHYKFI